MYSIKNLSILNNMRTMLKSITVEHLSSRGKKILDKSQFPEIQEANLEESYIKGSGPGGQNVNKRVNCVYLLHKPTGVSVKIHESRSLETNRKIARKRLLIKLDNILNKENSVENQMKKILEKKSKKKIQKQKYLSELKKKWKDSLSEF